MPTFDPYREYSHGLAGCYADPAARQRLADFVRSQGQSFSGSASCSRYGLVGAGEGKLSALFDIIERVFPGALPASAQTRGDCVSHSTRTACLATLASEIYAAQPDEVTGKVEGVPDIPEEGRRDGALSSEAVYWHRGRDSDGWSCEEAANVVLKKSGMWLRKPYPSIGVDLTRYSGETAGKWGSRSPPEEVLAIGREHLIRTATQADSFDSVRDLLAHGFGISTCGGESWAKTRNEDGVAERTREGWAHAISVISCDDRAEVKQKYGEPLLLFCNSWGKNWISGSRRVLGTDLEIPEGSFWSRWSDCKDRVFIAFSGAVGWPAKKLPNWTGGVL